MNKKTQLPDKLSAVEDTYSITICHNGFLVDISGKDKEDEWVRVKHVANTTEELQALVLDLAWMPRAT